MPEDSASTKPTETRRLAAIMFTDIVGFSRQMGTNEARMLKVLAVHNQVIQQAVADHHGQVIKTMGDGFLVDFPSVVHAVQCAQHVQAQFRAYNVEQDKDEQIHVHIGVHSGDIVQRDGDVFGDGVNVASRLQALAEPDTICISQVVYQEVEKKLPLGTVVSLGRPKLKNIVQRFQVYVLLPEQPTGWRQQLRVQRLRLRRGRTARLARAALLVMGLLIGSGIVTAVVLWVAPFPLPQSVLHTQAALPLPDKPSIVVLPFVNMSGDPDQEYFSDGITEDLTSAFSRLSGLFVISRNTAFFYKGKAIKMPELSKELGVQYVLEGSVRRANGQVRITTQLIDALQDRHLWSERYDRPLQDIFALQDDVVQKIVTTLKLQLTLQEQGWVVRKTTDNVEAYDAFLRAVEYHWRNTKEATAQARQMLEKAVALDPRYAVAYAGLCLTYQREWIFRWSTDPQTLERSYELVQKALALDDSLPVAHSLLGQYYALKQQYDQAITEGERAIALAPSNADAYQGKAHVLNWAGRSEEALQAMEQAMRLSPRYPPLYLLELGWAYRQTGRYAEAITTLKKFLNRSPNHVGVNTQLASSYIQQWISQQNPDAQTLTQAQAAAQRIIALGDPSGHSLLGYVYLWQHQYEQALVELEQAVALDPNIALSCAFLAEGLSHVGRSEEALQMVEQALRRPPPPSADYHLFPIGKAYYLAGRPTDAIAPLKQYLTRYPNILGAHLTLAAVYSELGQAAEARAEAGEVLRLNPQFSLEVHKERLPLKNPAVLERHLAALRKAGLK